MEKELKQNYVVYRHRNETTNEIFYIGSGTIERSKQKWFKTDVWKNIVSRDGYTIEIVAEGLSKDDSLELEYFMINEYGTLLDEDGPLVNIQRDRCKQHWTTNEKNRKNNLGNKHSEETKAKMSKSRLGNTNNLGKKMNDKTRDALRKANLGNTRLFGFKHSKETKDKMSKASLGNTNSLGNKHSKETKAKMSIAHLGINFSNESKAKMSLARRRKTISDENYELLLEDFSKIDKIIKGVTYKELSIRHNVRTNFICRHFLKYKK